MVVNKTTLKYFTSEIINNVNEHAKIDNCWILAQYYSKPNKTCEIIIADCGIGYKKSYEGTKYQVTNDKDAIINALEGKSSKTDWEGRGNGIRSISKLCVNGFGGKLVIISGNAAVYYKQGQRKEIEMESYWNGALVGINFIPKDINIYKFID
jgi:hypothetical protein